MRVAIVGCGKIADQHAQAVRRIPGSSIVAACDRERLMAQQFAERFGISRCNEDVGQMLLETLPDVVHITTPPQSHYTLGLQCLSAGAHVYLEKPFTVTAQEAGTLIETATRRNLKITPGHNYQFTPEMMAMRSRVEGGFLGGRPIHLESHWSYDLSDASYVGPLLGNPTHWVRKLPGQLLHNVISHGIARLAEFLSDDIVELVAIAHQSAPLRKLGGQDLMDELRVLIRDSEDTTAYFVFSTQLKPGINQFRICGPRNSLTVDLSSGTLLENKGKSYKSYLTFLGPPLNYGLQHLRTLRRNLWSILTWQLHQDSRDEGADRALSC